MKRYLLFSSILFILIPSIIFMFLNIKINKNIKINNEVLYIFNSIFKNNEFNIYNKNINLSKMDIQGIDYVGVIETQKDPNIPIESKCNKKILEIKSACYYSNEPFIILVTNLNDSFKNYELYEIEEIINFKDTQGITSQYRIKKIKRTNKLRNIKQYNADLIIAIKNYYKLEYILFLCEFY